MRTKRIFVILLGLSLTLLMAESVNAKWRSFSSKDEMTGEVSCYAVSPRVSATETMGFPYHDITAVLGVGVKDNSEWAYVVFSNSPNLVDTEIEDGYNMIDTRIKWDDRLSKVTLTQDWGSDALHFLSDKYVIEDILKSNTVLLELNWFGEGRVYFRFSLEGSTAAISQARSECGR